MFETEEPSFFERSKRKLEDLYDKAKISVLPAPKPEPTLNPFASTTTTTGGSRRYKGKF